MSQAQTEESLNRLLTILCRSFPAYLRYARPWQQRGKQAATETLENIAGDQQALAARVAEAIRDGGSQMRIGDFPLAYADWNDLSLEFTVKMALDYQQQDIEALQNCVDDLRLAPAARALAEEALGLAKGHRELLAELERAPA